MYGERFLVGLAQDQLNALKRDPRLERGDRRAVVAEFWDSLWELHNNQFVARAGAHFMLDEVNREAARQGVEIDMSAPENPSFQAAWERSEIARALIDSDFPLLNTHGVAAHVFALDTLIEDLAPEAQKLVTASLARELLERARDKDRGTYAEVEEAHGPQVLQHILETVAESLRENLGKPGAPRGIGSMRYEGALERAGLPKGRELPSGLERALAEAHTIRNVVAHRGGWVDARSLRECPDFPFPEGALLRLTTPQYRQYVAAVRSYAHDVGSRLGFPDVIDLTEWRENYVLGV